MEDFEKFSDFSLEKFQTYGSFSALLEKFQGLDGFRYNVIEAPNSDHFSVNLYIKFNNKKMEHKVQPPILIPTLLDVNIAKESLAKMHIQRFQEEYEKQMHFSQDEINVFNTGNRQTMHFDKYILPTNVERSDPTGNSQQNQIAGKFVSRMTRLEKYAYNKMCQTGMNQSRADWLKEMQSYGVNTDQWTMNNGRCMPTQNERKRLIELWRRKMGVATDSTAPQKAPKRGQPNKIEKDDKDITNVTRYHDLVDKVQAPEVVVNWDVHKNIGKAPPEKIMKMSGSSAPKRGQKESRPEKQIRTYWDDEIIEFTKELFQEYFGKEEVSLPISQLHHYATSSGYEMKFNTKNIQNEIPDEKTGEANESLAVEELVWSEVTLNGKSIAGVGKTKKEAKEVACTAFLKYLTLTTGHFQELWAKSEVHQENIIGKLGENDPSQALTGYKGDQTSYEPPVTFNENNAIYHLNHTLTVKVFHNKKKPEYIHAPNANWQSNDEKHICSVDFLDVSVQSFGATKKECKSKAALAWLLEYERVHGKNTIREMCANHGIKIANPDSYTNDRHQTVNCKTGEVMDNNLRKCDEAIEETTDTNPIFDERGFKISNNRQRGKRARRADKRRRAAIDYYQNGVHAPNDYKNALWHGSDDE